MGTFNIYGISLLEKEQDCVDVKWILLCKQIVENDENIHRMAWIDNHSCIATCDQGKQIYLSAVYEIDESKQIIDVLLDAMRKCNDDQMDDGLECIVGHILEYVRWMVLHHQMSVDFDDCISCVATCPGAVNDAGFFAVGGFSRVVQCFASL